MTSPTAQAASIPPEWAGSPDGNRASANRSLREFDTIAEKYGSGGDSLKVTKWLNESQGPEAEERELLRVRRGGYHFPVSASVVEVLEDQHRRIADLLQRISSPEEERSAVLRELLRDLAAHVAAERGNVEPVVRHLDVGTDLAGELADDYSRIEKQMVLIERRKFNSPDVPDLVTELKNTVEEHFARSERELYPALTRTLSEDERRELGEKVAAGGAVVAAHPHPHLLSLGPVADMMTRVAEWWDRARDRTVNNRHPGPRPGESPGSSGGFSAGKP